MKRLPLYFAVLLALSLRTPADVIEEGTGIVYGHDHVFSFTAPKGWMLDTESTPKTRVHAAFYPKGSTWKDSKVVAYATARSKTDTLKTVDDVVADTLKKVRADGSEKAQSRFVEKVTNGQGKELSIHMYYGDREGNFEAVAYVDEAKTINALVFTSRDEKAFRDAFSTFEELAKSYVFIASDYDLEAMKAAKEKAARAKREAAEKAAGK